MEKRPYEPPKITFERKLELDKLTRVVEEEPEFEFARELGKRYPECGIYLVGGCVRDIVLERDSKDYDFIVRRIPEKTLMRELKRMGQIDLVGKSFAVFKFKPEGSEEVIDIALPRRDISAGTGGYKDSEAQSDPEMPVEEDLKRRDFTMNAMAWDVRESKLIDPHGGLLDILEKKVKAVGDPRERFKEDYTRMLRALRQAAAFGFEIEPATMEAIVSEMTHINDERKNKEGKTERVVAQERIAGELLKGLKADPVRTMDLWDESGAIRELMPELLKMKGCEQPKIFHSEGDVWVHTRLALEKLSSPEFKELFGDEKPPVEVALAVLLHDVGKPLSMQTPEKDGVERISFIGHDVAGAPVAEDILRRLKFSAAEGFKVSPEHIRWLVEEHLFGHNVDPKQAKSSTIAKRFLSPNHSGRDLLMVTFADAAAAVRPDGAVDTSRLKEYVEVVNELEKKFGGKRVKPLLNGDDVMRILGIKPGPKVKEALERLIDAQGAGEVTSPEEAEAFLKK